MVKHFSVDWMAQSSSPSTKRHGETTARRCRPTCYGKDYLQPKAAKSSRSVERTLPDEDAFSSASPARSTSCVSPISEISGYSSGYESEAALSECPSGGDSEGGATGRRLRTKFTPEQINRLEKIFTLQHKYLDAGERLKTAQKLNLSETQIRNWFQNRRMKLKREVQDMRAKYFAPALSTVVFPPAFQYHDVAGQRFLYPATRCPLPCTPQAPPCDSCGYTSGSESEQGDDSEGEAGLHRRMRTKFTPEQISRLENTFSKHKYLGATQRRKIAEKLNLSETQVKTWFQNRRMKLKRDHQDMRPDFFPAPSGLQLLPHFLYPPAPAFQHQALGGQLPLYGGGGGGGSFPQPVRGLPFPPQQLVHQSHMHPMSMSMATPYYY
ncbi:hypothetical protein CRUP_018363 [Coryphaenoides rupestris]|nr:hypothetical protein CRUP_018363 [Coryphaenoides rupestris]